MTTQPPQSVKPIFALLGFICLILPIPVARMAIHFFAPAEDYFGYGGLGIGLTGMLITLITGASMSLVSLYRRERLKLFATLCLISQVIIVLWILFNLPG